MKASFVPCPLSFKLRLVRRRGDSLRGIDYKTADLYRRTRLISSCNISGVGWFGKGYINFFSWDYEAEPKPL